MFINMCELFYYSQTGKQMLTKPNMSKLLNLKLIPKDF